MTLLQLLQEAQALAEQGFMDAAWLKAQREKIEMGEKRIALTQTYVEAYQEERDSVVLDGSALMLDRKVRAQRALVESRNSARLYQEAVSVLWDEVEMEWIRAEHKKATAAREEVRA